MYHTPFWSWAYALTSDDVVIEMAIRADLESFTLGEQFLKMFYQVYDMDRNQMALAPNAYNSELKQPIVI